MTKTQKKKKSIEKISPYRNKKISIGDLGNMNATEIQSSIPDRNLEGREMDDLYY